MADFCKQCSIDMFGKDYGDLAGMVDPGGVIWTICEGCEDTVNGFHVLVDHEGVRRKDLESAWLKAENNRLSDER